ncbi:hypothetical protein KZP23_20785 [Echinicola marina]|uniref:hypothetical protein n=1 Tax=Echinicola marina TaxID=2859768 RepID=UPI001CF6EC2C|nr:hypothetical protein [Echinicola marina]UCS93069.1 hypothetical protein KZP23_20785 [Echinicola marina]
MIEYPTYRKTVAAIFLAIFAVLVVGPSAIALIDDQIDISICYSMVEEEEEEGTENHKPEKEEFVDKSIVWDAILAQSKIKSDLDFHRIHDYHFVLRDQFCPPPEHS